MKWGGGNAEFQLLATLKLRDTGTLGVRPGQGPLNSTTRALLVPGHPERSLVLYRMNKLGLDGCRTSPSSLVDVKGVNLIREWIKQLPVAQQN